MAGETLFIDHLYINFRYPHTESLEHDAVQSYIDHFVFIVFFLFLLHIKMLVILVIQTQLIKHIQTIILISTKNCKINKLGI